MPDPGPLPLILYSHQQVLDKLAVLRENALYCEPISAELEVPKKKSKSGKSGKVKSSGSAQPTATTSSSTSSRRPSDPESADKDLVFPDPVQPSVLSSVVDAHAELYNLPSFQFLHQLLEYLYSQHGLLLIPVSTCLISLFCYCCVIIAGFWVGFFRSSVPKYMVVGGIVFGHRHRSGSHSERVGDLFNVSSLLLITLFVA